MNRFTEVRENAEKELRGELAEVLFGHSAEARGSAVTFQSASERMKRGAYEYADLIIASGVFPNYAALLDGIVAGLRGDDQNAPVGMISVGYAEQVVREEFEAAGICKRTDVQP